MPTDPNLLAVAGIVYDIVGALWLAKAIAFSSETDAAKQAGATFNTNRALFKGLEMQTLDARYGLGILIAGFTMQLVAALNVHVALQWWPVPLIVCAAAVLACWRSARQLERTRGARIHAHDVNRITGKQ